MSVGPAASGAAERPSLAVISAIGFGQILSWGSTYYLPAVLVALALAGVVNLALVAPLMPIALRRSGRAAAE